MNSFGVAQAAHYASSWVPGGAVGSYRQYSKALQSGSKLSEGTPRFETYRSHALAEAERHLFLAASHYRRALDLMLPSASPWAAVTIYYGSFNAAKAILHFFGCAVLRGKVVDVEKLQPGSQRLRIQTIKSQNLTASGTHGQFWELFYNSVASIIPSVDASIRFALSPISSNPTWLTETRNQVNYDTHHALQAAGQLSAGFDPSLFPVSLPGDLGTQYQVLDALIEIGFGFAETLAINTRVLGQYFSLDELKRAVAADVYHVHPPALVRQSRKALVT